MKRLAAVAATAMIALGVLTGCGPIDEAPSTNDGAGSYTHLPNTQHLSRENKGTVRRGG